MSNFLTDHLKRASEPFSAGLGTARAMALGYPATLGMIFPFTGGVILLFRRSLYPTVGDWIVCGWAWPNATTIQNYRGFAHAASKGYQYAVAKALGNGFVSELSEPVRIDLDPFLEIIEPGLSMFPKHLTATPIAGGKFEITFEYDPYGQSSWPEWFRVYAGDSATLNYAAGALVDSVTGLAYVAFVPGQRSYLFTTAAYNDGTKKWFGARAGPAVGPREANTFSYGPFKASSVGLSPAVPLGVYMNR